MDTIMKPLSNRATDANRIAAVLSIVPGLGHVYKGHFAQGFIWMFLGMPIAIWAGVLLSLATAGAGLLLPILCWLGLGFDAYYEKDRRNHHWMPPVEEDE